MLDTVCLSESAGRKTPKDEAVIAKLQALQPSLDRHKIFDELLSIKHSDTASTISRLLFPAFSLPLLILSVYRVYCVLL